MNGAKQSGRIGGLLAWSRNSAETMLGPAHRGFRQRFERLVDPNGVLDPVERAVRADRARRAHMLTLAARSAAARKNKKVGSVGDRTGADQEARRGGDEPRAA